jgi:hypothetical protein
LSQWRDILSKLLIFLRNVSIDKKERLSMKVLLVEIPVAIVAAT